MKLLILRGIPASGKSTFADVWAREPNRVKVSRDSIRFALYNTYFDSRIDEDLVTRVQDATIEAALNKGKDVVVDDCNVSAKYVNRFVALAHKVGADVEIKVFDVDLKVALARNAARDRHVPEDVIRRFHDTLKSSMEISLAPVTVEPYVPNLALPTAVIVDVDGTLARNVSRSPYDFTRVSEDELIEAVADSVRQDWYNSKAVIVLSGRDDVCMQDTYDWLKTNEVPFDFLYMRKTGDQRKDWIVKLEIFNEHIRNKFNVLRCYDDRDQVVHLWRRQLGIPTYQVADGAF